MHIEIILFYNMEENKKNKLFEKLINDILYFSKLKVKQGHGLRISFANEIYSYGIFKENFSTLLYNKDYDTYVLGILKREHQDSTLYYNRCLCFHGNDTKETLFENLGYYICYTLKANNIPISHYINNRNNNIIYKLSFFEDFIVKKLIDRYLDSINAKFSIF